MKARASRRGHKRETFPTDGHLRPGDNVLVANRERLSKDIVQVVTESENESQHHQHDRGDESVKLIAFYGYPHDQRDQRRQHEAVKRGLVNCNEIDASKNHAEETDDEQRLMSRVAWNEQHDAGDTPERAGEHRT